MAFIYGSVARGTDRASSDIDIMIIGEDLSYTDILNAVQPVEAETGRIISVKILTREEWNKKVSDHNPFIERVLRQPLRWHGYRLSGKRYAAFQALSHTVGLGGEVALLIKAHDLRNGIEYDAEPFDDNSFLEELIDVNEILFHRVPRFKES